MRWLLIVGVVLVAIVVVTITVGALLPRDHVSAMSVRVAATPDMVWSAIADPSGFPGWRSDVQRVELLPPSATGPSWREHGEHGAISYVVETSEPPHRLVTRITDESLPFGGRWEYTLDPSGGNATTVTIVERGWVSNPLFRFVSRFIMGQAATIDAYLRALGHHFGGSDTPTTVAGGA
jgi:uncharacterized protein YndB with AHSA1/START domain